MDQGGAPLRQAFDFEGPPTRDPRWVRPRLGLLSVLSALLGGCDLIWRALTLLVVILTGNVWSVYFMRVCIPSFLISLKGGED